MTHRIYFAQHGLAVDKADDPERPLSPTGRQQTEIFASALNASSVSAIEDLSPNDDVTLLAQELNTGDQLYIGHLPHLEKLTAYLLTGEKNTGIIKFQNSGVLCLEKDAQHYRIKWLLSPELTGAASKA